MKDLFATAMASLKEASFRQWAGFFFSLEDTADIAGVAGDVVLEADGVEATGVEGATTV